MLPVVGLQMIFSKEKGERMRHSGQADATSYVVGREGGLPGIKGEAAVVPG
jgi:hypothetical protein